MVQPHAWHVGVMVGDGPSQVDLSKGLLECPDSMAIGFIQSEWLKKEQDRNPNVFYDLASETMECQVRGTLFATQLGPVPCGRRLWKGVTTRRQGLPGAILETGSPNGQLRKVCF